MKKLTMFVILGVLSCLIFPNQVQASKATCTYKYPYGNVNTFTFTYEYDKKLIVSPSVNTLEVSNKDFIDSNNNIVCPKLYIDRKIVGKNKYETSIQLASSIKEDNNYTKSRKIDGVLNIIVKDNKEKESNGQMTAKYCGYLENSDVEFQLYWDRELTIETIGKNFIEDGYTYTIKGKEKFSENDFANGKCPTIYTQRVAKAKNLIISKNTILTDDDPSDDADYVEDLNDGSHDTPNTDNNTNNEFVGGEEVYGCQVIPDEIRNWIKDALNLLKYVALVLVIVLGVLDFIKAAGSGEAEAMKKAGQDFLKRIIAVIILFLLPYIVDLILNLIEIAGADSTCLPQ